MRRMKFGAAAAALLMAAACSVGGYQGNGDDNYFSAFRTFDSQKWDYREPLTAHVDTLRDSVCRRGDLILTLRHTNGYEYANIWLELTSDRDSTLCDTFDIVLADSYGRWRGRGTGPSHQVVDTLRRGMTLHRGETLTLRHVMRADAVAGIEQVGLSYCPEH